MCRRMDGYGMTFLISSALGCEKIFFCCLYIEESNLYVFFLKNIKQIIRINAGSVVKRKIYPLLCIALGFYCSLKILGIGSRSVFSLCPGSFACALRSCLRDIQPLYSG